MKPERIFFMTSIMTSSAKHHKEELEKYIQKRKEAAIIRHFKLKQRTFIMTTRFNTKTRGENQRFRESTWANGCLYSAAVEVSYNIPPQSKMFVLEMDNDSNNIFAVGMCANRAFINKYSVYSDNNYNRYNYIGKHRIKRTDMNDIEEAVFKALDQLCFYGRSHIKRGHGLQLFPIKFVVNCLPVIDLTSFIEQMFIKRFPPTMK